MKKQTYGLILFIIVALTCGWFGVWVDTKLPEQPEGETLGMGLWLVLPIVAMLIIRLVTRDWKDIGIKFNLRGNGRWYLTALAIYPAVTLVTVGLAWLLGSVSVSSDVQWGSILSLLAISLGASFVKNIFEEFSWRGYLTPKLIQLKRGDWTIYLVSGLVWGLWHAAYYMVFLPDMYFETISRVGYVLICCVLAVGWSVMYTEIYRLTKSVWPCVLAHAVEDAVPTLLVTITGTITLTTGSALWLDPTTGIITTVIFVAIGLVLRSVRIRKDQGMSNGIAVEKEAAIA